MDSLLQGLNDFAVNLADSPWVYVVILMFSAFDALIPVVPSESVVVALAAIGVSAGEPDLVLLGVAAAAGAWIGDNVTFRLGALIGTERFGWMRRPAVQKAFTSARHELDRRAALLILTARYIPVGRVAVNLAAGASGFSYRRFLPLSALAAVSWASYAVIVGTLAGKWVEENPVLGAGVAVVVAIALGLTIDRLLTRWRARRD